MLTAYFFLIMNLDPCVIIPLIISAPAVKNNNNITIIQFNVKNSVNPRKVGND